MQRAVITNLIGGIGRGHIRVTFILTLILTVQHFTTADLEGCEQCPQHCLPKKDQGETLVSTFKTQLSETNIFREGILASLGRMEDKMAWGLAESFKRVNDSNVVALAKVTCPPRIHICKWELFYLNFSRTGKIIWLAPLAPYLGLRSMLIFMLI